MQPTFDSDGPHSLGPQNPASPAGHHFQVEERELPRVSRLLEDSFKDLQDNFTGYLALGLPLLCVAMGFGLFGGLAAFIGMFTLTSSGDPDAAVGLFFGGIFVFFIVMIALTIPMQAAQGRAIWRNLKDGEELSFKAATKDMGKDVVGILVLHFVIMLLTFVGAVFFFFPALIVAMLCSFALPAMIAHGVGPFEAIALSAGHARRHLWWHAKFWFLGTLVLMAASQVPILGTLLAGPWFFNYSLRAYRAAFGDGETLPIGS